MRDESALFDGGGESQPGGRFFGTGAGHYGAAGGELADVRRGMDGAGVARRWRRTWHPVRYGLSGALSAGDERAIWNLRPARMVPADYRDVSARRPDSHRIQHDVADAAGACAGGAVWVGAVFFRFHFYR